MATEKELEKLLREVLRSPISHTGVRSAPWVGVSEERPVIRYTALRIPNHLLDRIREAVK